MGQKQTAFTQDQLEEYQDCTFFTKKEILHIFKRYEQLGGNREDTLTMDQVLALQELKVTHHKETRMMLHVALMCC